MTARIAAGLVLLAFFLPAAPLSGQERVTLTILHTNDEHSNLVPHPVVDAHPELENPTLGGFARLAGLVGRIREEKGRAGEPVLLFSGGDIIGGPAFAWLALEGIAAELTLMRAIGYDGIAIGNHEFDYGTELLNDYLRAAGYPDEGAPALLGTNIHPPADHPLSDVGIRRVVVRELENGLTVGFFGVIGRDAVTKSAFPEPVDFEDPVEAARKAVAELRSLGADLVISVNHAGVVEDVALARAVPEIDFIVGGHSHTPLFEPLRQGKTVIVQAGSYLRWLGMLELSWDPATREVTVLNGERGSPFLVPLDHTVPDDPDVRARVDAYEAALNRRVAALTDGAVLDVRHPVAWAASPLPAGRRQEETALGNLITDALRIVTTEATGRRVDVAAQANGAIRGRIEPGTMEWSRGMISFYDLVMTSGLGSGTDGSPGFPVVAFHLTEDEVRRVMEISLLLSRLRGDTHYLQFSGVRFEHDPERVILGHVPFSGRPIPTSRAVVRTELWTGEGIQRGEDGWRRIERGSERLVHVATDYYIASFLPMVGRILPGLMIQLKDEHGRPIELDDAVVRRNGGELKVWQAVSEYAASLPPGESGLPEVPVEYAVTGERLVVVSTLPLWVPPAAALLLIALFGTWLLRSRRGQARRAG
jgi:5'-nucleotidase / UDP-sugar diphosphatase